MTFPVSRDFGRMDSNRLRLATGIGLGMVAGLATVADGPVAHAFDWLLTVRSAPFALTGVIVVAMMMTLLAATRLSRARHQLWNRQFVLSTIAIVCSLHFMAVDVGPINALNIMIVVMCTLWLMYRCVNHAVAWTPTGLFHLVALFMACVIASALNQAMTDVIRGWINVLPKLAVLFVLIDVLNDRRHVDVAVKAVVASSAVAAVAGIVQSACYLTLGWDLSLMAEDAPRFVIMAGLSVLRASGFQPTPHGFAQPLAVAMLIALCLAATLRGASRFGLLAAALIMSIAVFASVARGQWIGLAAGLAVLPLVVRPHGLFTLWVPLGCALILAGLASGLLPWLVSAIGGITSGSDTVRLELLGAGVRAMVDHPLTGVGIGNFGNYWPTFDRYPVHNAVVQIGSELGIVACVVYVAILSWVALRLAVGIRLSPPGHARDQIKALTVGYAGLLVAIQFEPSGFSEFVWIFLVLADSSVRVAVREARYQTRMMTGQPNDGPETDKLRPQS